jgi:DNA gyrase subunit A
MSVIVGRALPDVRDGLKPVHRRVLFAMHELGNDWNKAYKKSARVVGDVIGKYHPHGDSRSTTRSCAWRRISRCATAGRRPGQFRLGRRRQRRRRCATPKCAWRRSRTSCWPTSTRKRSISSRTTTVRERAAVLPARFPNLLVNGSSGIAVGMATNIPPHNLARDRSRLPALLDNPEITLDELMQIVPGRISRPPASSTAQESREGYKTGRGRVLSCARARTSRTSARATARRSSSPSCPTR